MKYLIVTLFLILSSHVHAEMKETDLLCSDTQVSPTHVMYDGNIKVKNELFKNKTAARYTEVYTNGKLEIRKLYGLKCDLCQFILKPSSRGYNLTTPKNVIEAPTPLFFNFKLGLYDLAGWKGVYKLIDGNFNNIDGKGWVKFKRLDNKFVGYPKTAPGKYFYVEFFCQKAEKLF